MDIKRLYTECVRVFKVTKKPDWNEFKKVFQITGLGIVVIGCIGFLVIMLYELLFV